MEKRDTRKWCNWSKMQLCCQINIVIPADLLPFGAAAATTTGP
jgi:hypothetical protein